MLRALTSFPAWVTLTCTLLFSTVCLVAGLKPPPQDPQREQLEIKVDEISKPWTGDLDGMVERRVIRVLTAQSKTFYFLDKGTQRGLTYEYFRLFEKDLNKKLSKTRRRRIGIWYCMWCSFL